MALQIVYMDNALMYGYCSYKVQKDTAS